MKVGLAAAAVTLFAAGALMPTAAADASTRTASSGSVLSTNWGGYTTSFVNPDPQSRPLSVDSYWTVPAVSCTQNGLPVPTGDVSVWDGLGGTGSSDLEQAGTVSQCILGIARFFAFVQLVPSQAASVQLNSAKYPVSPGDTIRAAVSEQGPGYFALQLWNYTKHWYYAYIWQTKDPNALPKTADWIVEDPTLLGVQQTFPKFANNIVFTNCYWYQDNAKHALILGHNLTGYTIIPPPPFPAIGKESTGPVATNGTGFYIRWKNY